MTRLLPLVFLFLLLSGSQALWSQKMLEGTTIQGSDSIGGKRHSPVKATLFSAVLPGLGQAYNKKYWKIPIIYGGIGVCMYYGLDQNRLFQEKRTAYVNRQAGDSTDQFLEQGNYFTNEGLLSAMDINRRNRDLLYIFSIGIYVLNIVDAAVDAHLFYFNVNEDLSIHYQPYLQYASRHDDWMRGISLSLRF